MYKKFMKIKNYLFVLLISILPFSAAANENFFEEARKLFDNKDYENSKFLFQRNIVFNPKDAKSYLYLAKIFQVEENNSELEKNLDTALLLEPDNEIAMYMLIDIELKKSNFTKVKELNKKFKLICSSLCPKISLINERLKNFQEKNDS
tara:strand:- start:321 stop:767 length:447 start_codon:yes stop_codon:yes gene_type:complete